MDAVDRHGLMAVLIAGFDVESNCAWVTAAAYLSSVPPNSAAVFGVRASVRLGLD